MKKKSIFTALSIILSLIIFLLLGETIIRLEAFIKGGRIWTPDKYLHVQHIPNTYFTNVGYYKEYRAKGKINNWGFIGRDCDIKKATDTYRIIVLGDSFTEAVQVDMDKNYCSQLERFLNRTGKRFEVINAGMSDYGPRLEYLYLRERLLHFAPDHIMLQLFPNDVYDDYKHKNTIDLSADLPLRRSFIYNHSQLHHYLLRQKAKLVKKFSGSREDSCGINRFFFIKKGNDKLKRKLWPDTENHLLNIKEILDNKGITLTIFTMPMEAQISSPEEMSTASQFYFKEPPTDDFDRAVKRFCRQNNIDFIDMLQVFRDNKNLNLYYPKEGHLTETGHKLVAEVLYKYLK